MDKTLINTIATQFGSPLFLINEQGVLQRYQEFDLAVKSLYPHAQIALSYKTNLLQGLLKRLHQLGAHAEVVSGIEYTIAKDLKLSQQNIIFNGPMKLDHEIIEAINDEAIIHCDHADELERIEQIAKNLQKKVTLGLRIYFSDQAQFWSRFGFAVSWQNVATSFEQALQKIRHSDYLILGGLHAHIGTNIRDMNVFATLGEQLYRCATYLKEHYQIELTWLDVGGGLAGNAPRKNEQQTKANALPNLQEYARAIITPLLPYLNSLKNPAQLYFEPGRTLFEAYASLLTTVIGTRPIAESDHTAYILDAGINSLATSYAYDFPVQIFNDETELVMSHLLGPTCNQADQLHSPLLLPRLKYGDLVLFQCVGSYCMSFSYSFIRLKPGVVIVKSDGTCAWLRLPESIEHLNQLEIIHD